MVSKEEFEAFKAEIAQKFTTAKEEWAKASATVGSTQAAMSQEITTSRQSLEAAWRKIIEMSNSSKRGDEEKDGRRGIERMSDGKNPKLFHQHLPKKRMDPRTLRSGHPRSKSLWS